MGFAWRKQSTFVLLQWIIQAFQELDIGKVGWSEEAVGQFRRKQTNSYDAGRKLEKINTISKTSENFQLWFLSRSTNGVLLYNGGQSSGSGDFISINIINGIVQLSYDLGSGVAKISSLRSEQN